jgi:twitching motility protein PilT
MAYDAIRVSAQLDQILSYLDKEGVTEIMIGMGQPASLRRRGQLIKLTNTPVTRKQLDILLTGTALIAFIPDKDGVTPRSDVQVGSRMIRVITTKRGEDIILRIEKSPPGATATPPPMQLQVKFGASSSSTTAVVPVIPATSVTPMIDLEIDPTDLPRRTRTPSKAIANRARGMSKPPESRTKTPTRNPVESRTKTKPPETTESRTRSRTKVPKLSMPASAEIHLYEDDELPQRPKAASDDRAKASDDRPRVSDDRPRVSDDRPRVSDDLGRASRPPGSFAAVLSLAIERGATDLHIASGRVTSIRVLGQLVPIDDGVPRTHAEAEALLLPLLDGTQAKKLVDVGYVDLAIAAPTGARLRANVSRAAGGLKGTFRIARAKPATLEELGLPKDLAKVVNHHQGLVVIAGPSGHGKTTTLSALVDLVNAARPHHIITVEDPIEIVYPRKAAMVSQREVGAHTKSFAAALKGSLREDPDVIVIGELRDRETVEIALTAAETGHLVIATMSTPSAAKTIDRLVDMFPPDDQSQVRASIAGALRAIVSQRLLPRADGQGVVAAIELVTGVLALANMIQRGKAFGMIRLDDTLVELVRAGRITAEAAVAASENKKELASTLRGGGTQAIPKLDDASPNKTSRIASFFGGKKDGAK